MVKFLFMVILINYSTAYNLELESGNVEEWHRDESEGYTTVTFEPHGDYSELRTIAIIKQRLGINAVYSLINDISQKAPSLSTLYVGKNQVKGQFDLGKLHTIKSLQMFSIYNNAINRFVSSATEDMPSLEHIDLEGNKIRFVDFEIFERYPNLGQLVLSDNKLIGTIDLGKFQPMKNMIRIMLDNNMITKIRNTATEDMPSVRHIVLTNNRLISVDLNDFAKFVGLTKLYLDGNKLTSIDGFPNARTIFPEIDMIAINRNEFKCDYFKEITKSYMWSGFWFEVDDMEESCSGAKSMYYKEKTCCYP